MTMITSTEQHQKLTLKDAAQMTGKIVSTIRRLIQDGVLKGEKKRIGQKDVLFVDRYELLDVMARRYGQDQDQEATQNAIIMERDGATRKLIEHLEHEIERIRDEYREFRRLSDERIRELTEENKRLNEEIKGILRSAKPEKKRRSIMGYLVERISGRE